jgi:signal transduction histidine kinase
VEIQADAAGQAALADLGELAAPMAHQVNNFLNHVLLDIAVLESGLPDPHCETVEEIRRQGRALAQVVRSWQQYRHSAAEPAWRTDAAGVVRRAVQDLAANPGRLGPIVTRFPNDPPADASRGVLVEVRAEAAPPVAFPSAELERLVRFLTANAIAISSRGQTVTVRTEPSEAGVCLRSRTPAQRQRRQRWRTCSTPKCRCARRRRRWSWQPVTVWFAAVEARCSRRNDPAAA